MTNAHKNLSTADARLAYPRDQLANGIVHIGVGNFHRGHQLVYLEQIALAGDLRWGVVGASMRNADVRNRLARQDYLYTVVERDGAGEQHQIVGGLLDVIVVPEAPGQLVSALAKPSVKLVTLTITEKAYHARDEGAAAQIAFGLERRKAAGLGGLTMLSCDNIAHNGDVLRNAVLQVAARRSECLHDWIATHAAFPNTMVDRIVPATTVEDIEALARATGYRDDAMISTEAFSQWVVEDRFCNERPDFESCGVTMVEDVSPWEKAKLQMLNGAHSAIAYLGSLAGYSYVDEALADPRFAVMVDCLWNETASTLGPVPGLDVERYRQQLMVRFRNRALAHKTVQIAMDGSQKLPQRLVAPLRLCLEQGQSCDALTLAIAGWMRWQLGRDEAGHHFVVDDPAAARTAAAVHKAHSTFEIVHALLSLNDIFGDLGQHPSLPTKLSGLLDILLTKGAAFAVMKLADAARQQPTI